MGPAARQWRWRTILLIVVAGLIANLLLIAVPGFLSHDELDWRNRIERHDEPWAFGLGSLENSPFFRLLGTVLISASLRIPLQPIGAHLSEVLLAVATAGLLYVAVSLFRPERALAAALLFLLTPGFAFGAGWIAAGFDVQFAFFGVLSVLCAIFYWRGESPVWLFAAIASFAAALACKETALSIPVCAALVMIVDRARIDRRRAAFLIAAAAGIVFIYFGLRVGPMLRMTASGTGGYKFGAVSNLLGNLVPYFGFAFAPWMMDVGWFAILSPRGLMFFAAPHLVLVGLILWRAGAKWALLYLAAFYATLLPVLPISKYETQYLYAGSIATALALALVWERRWTVAVPVAALTLLMVAHTARLQLWTYESGSCQTRALNTLQAVLPEVAPDAPRVLYTPLDRFAAVLVRSVADNSFPLRGQFVRVATTRAIADATLVADGECRIAVNPPR